MKLKFQLSCLILALTFSLGSFAPVLNAQSLDDVLVNITPPNPAPGENTTITLKSYVNNLDTVLISWLMDGKTLSSGIGKKSFSITAPGAGKEAIVTARVSLADGARDTKISIRPAVMVLLWQANDSYVPPFYKGKALPSADSEIKMVAMPEIRTSAGIVPPQELVYYWENNYTNEVAGSGYGKNFFIFRNDYLEDSDSISVTASTLDKSFSSNSTANIAPTQPKILFYRNDPDFGTVWQNSLKSPHRIGAEEIIEAAPYFISPSEIQTPALNWKWSINDNPIKITGQKKNILPLLVETGLHGTSKLMLEIENREKIFEQTIKEINIEF